MGFKRWRKITRDKDTWNLTLMEDRAGRRPRGGGGQILAYSFECFM